MYEYKILGYNLNFVPTPKNVNKNELLMDINKFNRKIKLKAYFDNSLPKDGIYFKNDGFIYFYISSTNEVIVQASSYLINVVLKERDNGI